MMERASTPSSICMSDPQWRDETVAQEGAQISVKKGVHFGTYRSRVSVHASHEALTLHSLWLTLLVRRECLKRHGVGEHEGELGADFTSWAFEALVSKLPSASSPALASCCLGTSRWAYNALGLCQSPAKAHRYDRASPAIS